MAKKAPKKVVEANDSAQAETNFEFTDKEIVEVIGTDDKRFPVSPKVTYKVSGSLAKLLIKKGAAILKPKN